MDVLNWLSFFLTLSLSMLEKGPGEVVIGNIFENLKNFGMNDFFRLSSKGGCVESP